MGEGSNVRFTIWGYFATDAKQVVPSLSVKKLIYYPLLVKNVKSYILN